MAIWLTMAPLGGFFNGILAYAVAFAPTDKLQSWRILYLMEGQSTLDAKVSIVETDKQDYSLWSLP